jgi:glycosyltransferase involved in cell wall biosynthesis
VLPSEREGLPRSVLESLALGVPAIGCKARGTEELLEDRCGVIVPIGDVGSLSQAMIWMSTNPEEAAEMGRLGRRKVLERYDLPHSLAVTEALYRRILDKQ